VIGAAAGGAGGGVKRTFLFALLKVKVNFNKAARASRSPPGATPLGARVPSPDARAPRGGAQVWPTPPGVTAGGPATTGTAPVIFAFALGPVV